MAAKELRAPVELVREIAGTGKLPVVLFTAGGIATPADAAMMMQLGADGVFVGSGIFKSGDPEARARAIVEATTNFESLFSIFLCNLLPDAVRYVLGVTINFIMYFSNRICTAT